MQSRLLSLAVGAICALAGSGLCEDKVPADPRVRLQPRAKKPGVTEFVGRPNIRVESTLVLIPVTVIDSMSRFVTGLEKEHFKLFEDNQAQTIISFSSEDTPVSVGVVFDCSGSMGDKLVKSREAVAQFVKRANPEDEFFLMQFSDATNLLQAFTMSPAEIQNRLTFTQSKGRTALLDAVYRAIHETKKAGNPRKALVIISDGGDNNSRYSEGEIKRLVKEADVQIYAIGIYEPIGARSRTPEELTGPGLLTQIAEQTGGRQYPIENVTELADVATKIGVELRNQYILGYAPRNQQHDGKYRRVQVKLNQPKGLPPLRAYWRMGYYAPTE